MKLLIIAGFLGSGKTTLLLQVAKHLAAASQRIAIIENEMGEVGVDGEYLTLEGLHVQELLGGCICCTLAAGLVGTLEKVQRLFQPTSSSWRPPGLRARRTSRKTCVTTERTWTPSRSLPSSIRAATRC